MDAIFQIIFANVGAGVGENVGSIVGCLVGNRVGLILAFVGLAVGVDFGGRVFDVGVIVVGVIVGVGYADWARVGVDVGTEVIRVTGAKGASGASVGDTVTGAKVALPVGYADCVLGCTKGCEEG